eukprot:NODE_636_length_5161_cov_0.504544.p1 type:complete len:477 gc:universal NODE_636_length_5161_cov_0.504544:4977-3547(-)
MPTQKVLEMKKRIKARKRQAEVDNELFEKLYKQESGFLQADEGEQTYNISQNELKSHLDDSTIDKLINLKLEYAPYRLRYSRNGSHVIIGGSLGQVATMDWRNGKVYSDIILDDQVRDVTYLQNHLFYAVAQNRYVYMYDQNGAELHSLEHHTDPTRLEYLPYHYLLASCSNNGSLTYTDISMGTNVSKHRSKMGQCQAMGHNFQNGIVSLGHYNGTVTFWQPTMSDYAMKMMCHKNRIQDICFDSSGNYMITSGNDMQIKVFDLRKLEQVYSYFTNGLPSSIDMSANGVLAVALNSRVQFWKNPHLSKERTPYMQHTQEGSAVNNVRFVPYEDILGFGHQNGVRSIVVPGAGAAYDGLESNPFETTKQRREKDVNALLEKLAPETIQLKSLQIGKVNENAIDENPLKKAKDHIRKKNMSGQSWARLKQRNIIDEKTEQLRDMLQEKEPLPVEEESNDPLDRFKGKRRQIAKSFSK